MKRIRLVLFPMVLLATGADAGMVDTGQAACYDTHGEIACPAPGEPFFGQDAQYRGARPAYRDNGDGTVGDLVTGLTWSKAVDPVKVTPEQAAGIARRMTLGGHADWRVPSIKELYSLIDFRGYAGFSPPPFGGGRGGMGSGGFSEVPSNAVPFIDTDHFDFRFGDTGGGERYIDAQWLSSTLYAGLTMEHMTTVFGVNFADGRIKGYGYRSVNGGPPVKGFFARYVRGPVYGVNDWRDNGDGTLTDAASGLAWQRDDSGRGMDWQSALAYCESLVLAGRDDWRLPDAKELQFIVDYARSPDATGSAAIDPLFHASKITNEMGADDHPFYWTSTTHLDGPRPGTHAAYVAFGRAIGQMRGRTMDVHGAGAQRGDPKVGRARLGQGPQGDAQRIDNHVRCVRGGGVVLARPDATPGDRYPNNVRASAFAAKGTGGPAARPGGDAGFGAHFVSRLDRDGDGKVSRREFDGPPHMFDRHDANGDGYLDAGEAPPPPPGFGR